MRESIKALLRPASVAIVGATPGAGRGGWIHEQLLRFDYDGPIYPVNPKYDEVRGAKAYPSLAAIPGPVEFVAVALGAGHALRVMQECVDVGARAALFIAGGFAETGPTGQAIQAELRALALRHQIALCGPNCYGIANIHGHFAAYGGSLVEPLRPGPIALLFQSGALTHSVTDPSIGRIPGYSYIITTGNEAVLEIADYVAALADDPQTRVIACFVESFKSPERFFAAARRAIAHGKRLVVLKTGRSELAQRAALAHTGALTGPDALYDALFRQIGIARVADLDELVATATLLSQELPLPVEPPVIISISGGSCGIAADLAQHHELALPPPSEATAAQLRDILPSFATVNNPLDMTGAIGEDPSILPRTLETLCNDPAIGSVALALNTPIGGDEAGRALYQLMSRRLAESATTSAKQHLLFSMSSGAFDPGIVQIAAEAGLPLLLGMREAIAAMAHSQRLARRASASEPASTVDLSAAAQLVQAATVATFSERESKAVLAAAGLRIPQERLATTAAEATAAAEQIGFPVVLKIESADIAHKTEAGGVKLNLRSAAAVAAAFEEICANARQYQPEARTSGVSVQAQISGGLEALVGITNHDGFGPVVVFGLGGIFAEALRDVSMRAAPLTHADAAEMLAEIRAAPVLQGWRGGPPLDIAALTEALVRIGQLAWELRDYVREIDINPLLVLPAGQGVYALDGLIVMRETNEY